MSEPVAIAMAEGSACAQRRMSESASRIAGPGGACAKPVGTVAGGGRGRSGAIACSASSAIGSTSVPGFAGGIGHGQANVARILTMRLFIAVTIDADVVARMLKALTRFASVATAPRARVRWVPADQLHVTVRFIGEASETQAANIATALGPALPLERSELVFRGLGVFPEARRAARVLGGHHRWCRASRSGGIGR